MSKPRIPRSKRAAAAARVLVDGMSKSAAARDLGISEASVRRVIEEVGEDASLAAYVEAYRARALPRWLEVMERATARTIDALPRASARDAAQVAKTFAEMASKASGEPDHRHEIAGRGGGPLKAEVEVTSNDVSRAAEIAALLARVGALPGGAGPPGRADDAEADEVDPA